MFKTITSAELLTQLKQTPQPIIDVREDYEFQDGHIPGARSGNACAFLSQQGYNVTNIMGGMAEWQGAVD